MTFDPCAPKGSAPAQGSPSRDVVVFMIGGGCYAEAIALQEWAGRGGAQSGRRVLYGCTDLLSGEQMLGQVAQLGKLTGS